MPKRTKLFFTQLKEICKNLGKSFKSVAESFDESEKKINEIMKKAGDLPVCKAEEF